MLTRKFWRDATERALSTAAQSALLVIGADQFNVLELDWTNLAGFAGGGAFLAVLKAMVAAKTVGEPDSASLDPEVRTVLIEH